MHFAEMRARFERQMSAYMQDVGRRMREARERNRPDLTSHEKAAHELGVSGKQYGRWERGESQPRPDKWSAIAEMLDVSVESLRGSPPIAPEEELRAQLTRIEEKLDAIADAVITQLRPHDADAAGRVERAVAAAGQASRDTQPGSSGAQEASSKTRRAR